LIEENMKQERIDPGWAWTKKLNISAGVKLGDMVYTSGTVAFDSEGNVVGEGDVYAQSKQIFKNIRTEAFPAGVPASAAYATPALIKPKLLVEVEAIAVIGSGD
jgi:enamine deaminase RidA (YjgF/YER057c/UK114 family)